MTAALSVSGLPTDRFCFEGFLPAKKKARRDLLARLSAETRTLVFYESIHRICESLADLEKAFGPDRPAFFARELTKVHEECIGATLGQLRQHADSGEIVQKGEVVLVVSGTEIAAGSTIDVDWLLDELAGKMPDKEVARIVAMATGEKRNKLYKRLLERASGPSK